MKRYLLLVLALAGCSTTVPMWTRADATEEVFRSDARQCEVQARTIAAALDAPIEPARATEATRAFQACLKQKGWDFVYVESTGKPTHEFKPDDDRCSGMYHRAAAWLACMRQSGWTVTK